MTIRRACCPAASVIVFVTVRNGPATWTSWRPAVRPVTTIGVMPRATPSTVTRPPAGSLRISMAASATVDGAGGANSKEWAVMVPPASDSGTCRVAPSSVTSSAWLPSLSSRRSGVLPRGVPSIGDERARR